MLILGILSSTDVVYLFVVGETPILAAYVFAFFCLAVTLLTRAGGGLLASSAKKITKDLLLFFLVSALSIFLAYHYFPEYGSRSVNGFILLFLVAVVFLFVLMFSQYKDSLIRGLFIGLVLNFLFSVLALILFQFGVEFSLRDYFPRMTSIVRPSQMYIYRYSAWGLFREPGYFMRWLAIVFFLVWDQAKRSRSGKIFMIVMTLFIVAFTRSAATFIFSIAMAAYLFLTGSIKTSARNIVLSVIALLLIGAFVAFDFSNTGVLNLYYQAFMDFFSRSGNAERRTGMLYGWNIVQKYFPTGCGWNMFPTAFQAEGYYGANIIGKTWGNVLGAYSGAITLMGEIGVFAVFYFFFILSKGIHLLKQSDLYRKILGLTLFTVFALFCSTNMQMEPILAIVFALAVSELKDAKKRKEVPHA